MENLSRQDPVGERLLNPKEMAKILGVPVSWLYQRTRLGPKVFPHVKVGKYVRFDPEEVLTFLRTKGSNGNSRSDGVS